MTSKTLVLTENFPPLSGGSARWFWELYSRLPVEQFLLVVNDTKEGQAFDKTHPLNIIRMPLVSPEWGFRSIKGITFYYKAVLSLRKIIKQHNITHIHTGRVIHEGVIAWLLSLITNVSYSTYVHGEDVETAAISREHDLMVKQVCKRASRIICNSHNSANIVKRLAYAGDEKISVLHPGFDQMRFSPAKVDPHFKEQMGWQNKQVIITVGRLQQRKGQDAMIMAMPNIIAEYPDVHYVIIGHGECEEQLKKLITELKLTDHVQLLTNVTDQQMVQCYQQCDLFILPNRTINNDIEGFGMVLVEAQACGKPVIAGDSGGTRETMALGESGMIVDCSKPEIIAQEINLLLADKTKLITMGEMGVRFVNTHFTWDVHLEKAKKVFASAHE